MDELLRIEVRLLVLRYGRRRILEALAACNDQTPEEVEAELASAEQRKASRKRKGVPSASELVANACQERPGAAQTLQRLAARYDNRTFLPHLREVKRFFDRTGFPHGQLKSRRAAARQVVKALSRLKIEELENLAASPLAQGDSDFAMLAREIMGRGAKDREP